MDGTLEDSFVEEREISDLCVSSKSSLRVTVSFRPEKLEGDNWLKKKKEFFYLLFELRSPREYGEISLFCEATVCGSFIEVTPLIDYQNCKRGKVHEKNLVLTNKVRLVQQSDRLERSSLFCDSDVRCIVSDLPELHADLSPFYALSEHSRRDSPIHCEYCLFL